MDRQIFQGDAIRSMELWSVRRLRRRARSSRLPGAGRSAQARKRPGSSRGDMAESKDEDESLLESVLRASTLSVSSGKLP